METDSIEYSANFAYFVGDEGELSALPNQLVWRGRVRTKASFPHARGGEPWV